MFFGLFLGQTLSASSLLHEAWDKIEGANSLTVTVVRTTEEFKHEKLQFFFYRKGGYFRAQTGARFDVGNPKQGWAYRVDNKTYQATKPLPPQFDIGGAMGLSIIHAGLPILAGPRAVTWHQKPALRIELDGRRLYTKETELYAFLDPKTHLPLGISANLGSVTQVIFYRDLKINPVIKDSLFQFTPPKGWTRLTSGYGGSN